MSDPQVQTLLTSGALTNLRFFDARRGDFRGPKKFDFRARMSWSHFRPSGFRRSDHRPGGFKLWKTIGKGQDGNPGIQRNPGTRDSRNEPGRGTGKKGADTSEPPTIAGSENGGGTRNASMRIAAGKKEKETWKKGADTSGLPSIVAQKNVGGTETATMRIPKSNQVGGGGDRKSVV